MTETAVPYERVTVPKFRKILKETGMTLDQGTYFEELTFLDSGEGKPYARCSACAVGTIAAYHSQLEPEELEKLSIFQPQVLIDTLHLPFPLDYLAGLEHSFEGWVGLSGIAEEANEQFELKKWKHPIDVNSKDFKLGKADGARLRRADREERL